MVSYYTGLASELKEQAISAPAVTIAGAKKKGSNGVSVANAIIERVNNLKGARIPANVDVSITRDYGQTANEKVNELIFKLFVATSVVFFLVLLAFRALRPAIVVVLVITVTGFSLSRPWLVLVRLCLLLRCTSLCRALRASLRSRAAPRHTSPAPGSAIHHE